MKATSNPWRSLPTADSWPAVAWTAQSDCGSRRRAKHRACFRASPFSVDRVAFSPDGRSLAASETGGSLRVWDVAAGHPARQFPMGEDHYYPSFAYAPDGRTLAVRNQDGTIRLLDPATGEEKRRLTAAAKYGKFLCFSPDGGKLAALSWPEGAAAQFLQLWDTATGAETRKWTFALRSGFFPMLFSPDGRFVIGGSSDPSIAIGETKRFQLHFWDVATGEERAVDAPQQATVKCLAISSDGHTLAWGDLDGTITLWELAANQVRRRLKGHYSHIRSIAFSPDGTTLASGSADTTVLLWNVTGRPTGEHSGTLSAEGLHLLWDDLANTDAAKAFDAIGLLTATPDQAIPMLKAKLHPAPAPAEKKQIARLLADLDSERFEVRQKVMEELKQLGERAEPGLREALQDKLPLEARKRVEELLEGVAASATDPQRLRDLRAVEALEHIGTPEARQVLQTLADGAPTARLTREAKASLQRIAKRR